MTLIDLNIDTPATIADIQTDCTQRTKLKALGICVGATIEKKQQQRAAGPIYVCTQQQCHFAIGHDLASKIFLNPE